MNKNPSTRLLRKRKKSSSWLGAIPYIALLLILGSAVAATYLIDVPLHPNLHPRLTTFCTYLAHNHPRLSQLVTTAPLLGFVGLQLFIAMATFYHKFQVRKNGLLSSDDLRLAEYLNCSIRETYCVVQPIAWKNLKDVLPGLLVKAPDVRAVHWELIELDENLRQLRLELRYVHDPLGIKVNRLYPRKLSCLATLRGKGTSTEVEFKYSADSAMDYQSVRGIIDDTHSQVRASMESQGLLTVA